MAFAMPEGYFLVRQPGGRAGEGPPPSAAGSILDAVDAGRSNGTLTAAQRSAMLADLRRWGVGRVVLGPGEAHAGAMRALLTAVMGTAPVEQGGVLVWDAVPH